jgi:hypothetical protein
VSIKRAALQNHATLPLQAAATVRHRPGCAVTHAPHLLHLQAHTQPNTARHNAVTAQ